MDGILLLAAYEDDVERLKVLLDNGEDPDQRGEYGRGYTALNVAAAAGHCQSTEFLIGRGANVDLQNDDGDASLHSAALRGHYRVAMLLISHARANVNLRNNYDDTPLHYAAVEGHVQVVEVLLENGAAVDEEDNYGDTPLCDAAMFHNWDVMRLLVRHNASVPGAFQRLVSTERFLQWIEDGQRSFWRGMVQLLRYHYHGTNRNGLRPPPLLEDIPSDEVFLQKHRWMIHPLASLLHKGSGRVLKLLFQVCDPAGLVMEECYRTNRIPLWTALQTWQPQPEGRDQREQPQLEGWDQQELQRATEGLEVLLDAASEQLSHPNNERVSPLLYALEKRLPPQIISKMVDLWPAACGAPHPLNHRIPMALAIEAHMPWWILEEMIQAYPKSVAMEESGLLMWQLAASRDCGVTEIYGLLRECPHTVASYVVPTE